MKKIKTRTQISVSGSFVSVPSAFPLADEGLKNALKLGFETLFSEDSSHPLNLETRFYTDVILIDLGAVAPSALDPQKIINDCDLVKRVASTYPDQLRQLVTELQAGSVSGIERAEKIAKEIGLTEEASVKAGGGLLGLLIAGAIGLIAGGCAGTKHAEKPRAVPDTKPRQPEPQDGGPGPNGGPQ